jgi:uncharacterized coiled-coil DUF342 family protein
LKPIVRSYIEEFPKRKAGMQLVDADDFHNIMIKNISQDDELKDLKKKYYKLIEKLKTMEEIVPTFLAEQSDT